MNINGGVLNGSPGSGLPGRNPVGVGVGLVAERDRCLPCDQGRQGQGARVGLPGGQDRGSPCHEDEQSAWRDQGRQAGQGYQVGRPGRECLA